MIAGRCAGTGTPLLSFLSRGMFFRRVRPWWLYVQPGSNGVGFVVFVAKWGFGTNVKKDGTYMGAREGYGVVILWREVSYRVIGSCKRKGMGLWTGA